MKAAALVEFARIGFLNMMAYRLRYYTGVLTYFINVAVYYFIWKAVHAARPGYGGFDFQHMATYVAVGWVIRSLYFNNIDHDMAIDVMEGKIAMTMLRPVNLPLSFIARALGEAAFRLTVLTAPASVVMFFAFGLSSPASAWHLAAFLAAVAGAILIVASINFVAGSMAVVTRSVVGLLRAKFYMMELLSGLLLPVSLFPPVLRKASAWLPFEHINFTPLMIYLGKYSWEETALRLAAEWIWVAMLLCFCVWHWNRLARRISVHGG